MHRRPLAYEGESVQFQHLPQFRTVQLVLHVDDEVPVIVVGVVVGFRLLAWLACLLAWLAFGLRLMLFPLNESFSSVREGRLTPPVLRSEAEPHWLLCRLYLNDGRTAHDARLRKTSIRHHNTKPFHNGYYIALAIRRRDYH